MAGVLRRLDGAAARVAGLDGPPLDAAPAAAVPARAGRAVAGQPQPAAGSRRGRRHAPSGRLGVHPADQDHARGGPAVVRRPP